MLKDTEARLAWTIKDEMIRLGRVYYAKLKGGRTILIARRLTSGTTESRTFNKALDELHRSFKVIPCDVIYKPTFTYIWTVTQVRFRDELKTKLSREDALTEIARAYLIGAGMTARCELASVTGLSKPDAGLGNWALVDEGFSHG